MNNNIGPKKRQNGLEKSLGNWVVINVTGNGALSGKIKDVNGREITLNPHKAYRYDEKHKCNIYQFVEEDAYLEVSPNGYYLEPTNIESLEYYTKKQNEDILEAIEKRKGGRSKKDLKFLNQFLPHKTL